MIFNKIWERYFIKQIVSIFLLFIVCFYGLYVLIDYSSRGNSYRSFHFSYLDLAKYYLYLFLQRLDILIPFAFLIACVRTLCLLNSRNELIALMASGIKLKTLLRPFLACALLLTTLLYINNEFLLPYAWKSLRQLEDSHFEEKNLSEEYKQVQHILLNDNKHSSLYSYDSTREIFHDVYWIRSLDDIYYIKKLSPYREQPLGEFVSHFLRDKSNKLLLKDSWKSHLFPEIRFNQEAISESLALPNEQSLTNLWKKLPARGKELTDRDAQVLTSFYYKLAMPWLCLLVFIAPAPFCLKFSRQMHVFMIYICSMFGTVAFYLIVNTGLVMGESQVIPPAYAVGVPFAAFFIFFGWRFLKLR